MKKQILSFLFLSLLGLLQSFAAAPTNASSSTEESDRQFLENLERADAAKETRATAPVERETAPAALGQIDKSHLTNKTVQGRISTRRLTDTLDFDASEQIPEPDDVADSGAASDNSSAKATHVAAARPVKSHHTARHSGEHRLFHHILERLLSHHPEDW